MPCITPPERVCRSLYVCSVRYRGPFGVLVVRNMHETSVFA